MAFHDDEIEASVSLMDRVTLLEKEPRWKSEVKKVLRIPILLLVYLLGAHALGWMLAIQFASPRMFTKAQDASGDDLNRIIPPMKTKPVRFGFDTRDWVPGPNDSNVTDAIWDNWTSMLPIGNGYVKIPDWPEYPFLTKPTEPVNDEPAFNTAWVHQLHCLYWVMQEYHRVLHHGPDGTEYFIDPTHNSYHTSHCFNYLRQSILCSLDTTLEGSGDGVGVGDGSGQTHMCRDNQQSIKWLEAHRHIDWRAI